MGFVVLVLVLGVILVAATLMRRLVLAVLRLVVVTIRGARRRD